jgi:hypothetical protein
VERSDVLVTLTPGSIHADRLSVGTKRNEFACYRTYRRRAFCVMEMFASYLSRRKTHPILLVQSRESAPFWNSNLDVQKISLSETNFTCCERNHVKPFDKCSKEVVYVVI